MLALASQPLSRSVVLLVPNGPDLHRVRFLWFHETFNDDAIIKDYAAFMPSCNISGEMLIEEGVYCGTGVKIITQTSIGEYATIGAEAVVTKSILGHCTAVGVPARVVK